MIVEKQLKYSMSWNFLLKYCCYKWAYVVSVGHSCYASLKYFGYFNNDKNMLCMLYLVLPYKFAFK